MWVVLLCAAIGVTLFAWEMTSGLLLLILLTFGILSSLYVALLRKRGYPPRTTDLATALAHGTLSLIGVLGTGGVNSRFAPFFTLVLTTLPLRFRLRHATALGSGLIFAFVLGSLLHEGLSEPTPLMIFTGLNFLAILMSGSLIRRKEVSQARLIQTAAHELRNPMAVIKGTLSLLRRRAEGGKAPVYSSATAATMEHEVDRLSSLIDEIMEAFLIWEEQLTLELEQVNLKSVASSALASLAGVQGRDRVIVRMPEEVPVAGDAARLEEVVRNLIYNAIKYSPDGAVVKLDLIANNGKALLSVQDSGPGIQRTHLAKVFDPLYRLSDETGRYPRGIGLGLYICQFIVGCHHGKIWVESDGAVGATFYVELPLNRRPVQGNSLLRHVVDNAEFGTLLLEKVKNSVLQRFDDALSPPVRPYPLYDDGVAKPVRRKRGRAR